MPVVEPITNNPDPDKPTPVRESMALALSGGGYRAMLFHTGTLWRLGQLGFYQNRPFDRMDANGDLVSAGKLERISSVSGGSIVSAKLALEFASLENLNPVEFDNVYRKLVVDPIRHLAETTLAGMSVEGVFKVIKDIVMPGEVNAHVAKALDDALYQGKKLQDLPDRMRFIFNASNLQSGAVWRFSRPYMGDWKVGRVMNPKFSVARAVGASAAFPPILAPATLTLQNSDFDQDKEKSFLRHAPYTTSIALADGGVYDNLGLETCYKSFQTLFVSNAGKPFSEQPEISANWVSLGSRCLDVMDNQVLSLRKRLLIQAYKDRERYGAFWDIKQDIGVHNLPDCLPCPYDSTRKLAQVPTDLAAKDIETQKRLINWGYAVADAAIRAHFNRSLQPPANFPYPEIGV
ncbi:patatin-like phospholipase family protein [Pseudomonas sp. B2M1-30]|uniref:patatin-like phospholipase family protein n=1 Tax=Pseudomonas TaxID=286 RepID=UPI0021C7DB8E|nr:MULTISPECIES: patatin-like phospholipase family protein [Pseudomonas]MCU0117716.1 patatin-like phospholipase family protein [Pseudomonas sp. B2M1-30]MCU7259252.1 patatin-like phospholipase family protein [Pseudomonas koreensis]